MLKLRINSNDITLSNNMPNIHLEYYNVNLINDINNNENKDNIYLIDYTTNKYLIKGKCDYYTSSYKVLELLRKESESRYNKIKRLDVGNIEEYNNICEDELPYCVLIMKWYVTNKNRDKVLLSLLELGKITGIYTLIISDTKNIPFKILSYYVSESNIANINNLRYNAYVQSGSYLLIVLYNEYREKEFLFLTPNKMFKLSNQDMIDLIEKLYLAKVNLNNFNVSYLDILSNKKIFIEVSDNDIVIDETCYNLNKFSVIMSLSKNVIPASLYKCEGLDIITNEYSIKMYRTSKYFISINKYQTKHSIFVQSTGSAWNEISEGCDFYRRIIKITG